MVKDVILGVLRGGQKTQAETAHMKHAVINSFCQLDWEEMCRACHIDAGENISFPLLLAIIFGQFNLPTAACFAVYFVLIGMATCKLYESGLSVLCFHEQGFQKTHRRLCELQIGRSFYQEVTEIASHPNRLALFSRSSIRKNKKFR
jgi:hypothetical protein